MGHNFPDGPPDWWWVFFMPDFETIAFTWGPVLNPDSLARVAGHRAGKIKQKELPTGAFMDSPVFSSGKFVS